MAEIKYQEKIDYIDNVLKLMREGKSKIDIENYLKEEGLKKWDIKKINQSIETHFNLKYKSKMKSYMLNNTLESKISEFDEIDDGLFEKLQYDIIDEIIFKSKKEVKLMIGNRKSVEEIVEKTTNQFFDKEAVYNEIELINKKNSKINNKNNRGIFFIGLGVILSIVGSDLLHEGVVVVYGFVIYGFITLFKK